MLAAKNMVEEMKNYVKKCLVCERTKVIRNTKVPMQISSLSGVLLDHTFIDFVGPILASALGNKYFFKATCDLTKFLEEKKGNMKFKFTI